MGLGFMLIESGLDMSIEMISCFIAFVAGLIFYSLDFKIGTLLHMFSFAGLFVIFYVNNMIWSIPLIFLLISIVILSLSLYAVSKVVERGAYI